MSKKKIKVSLRHSFQAPEGYNWVSCDLASQEMKTAAVLSKDEKLSNIYILEDKYNKGIIPKPKDPEGNEYQDPLIDGHIVASTSLNEEVKYLVDNKPWLANKKTPIVDEFRDKGKVLNYCVPVEGTKTLTKKGWKSYSELKIGEEILVYDSYREINTWSPILKLNYFENQEVYKLGNSHSWSTISTLNHRWIGDKRVKEGKKTVFKKQVFTTESINRENRIRTTAKADIGWLDLTEEEVEIIAWIITDGYLKWSKLTGKTSQCSGSKRHANVRISQKKEINVQRIDKLLEDWSNQRYVSKQGVITWILFPNKIRDLWIKANLNQDNPNWEEFILNLKPNLRKIFLHTVWLAEGYIDANNTKLIAQNEGKLLEAFILATFLEGYEPRVSSSEKNKTIAGNYNRKLRLRENQYIGCQKIKRQYLKNCDVWCPTTLQGTWVMRQGNTITITGNSLIYGSSAANVSEQLKSSLEEAEAMIEKYFSYPNGFYNLGKWLKVTGNLATQCRWVKTPTGRFIYTNESNAKGLEDRNTSARKACNAIIQSLGTDMLKLSLPKIEYKWEELNKRYNEQLKGRQPKLVNLSHDEVNAAVPGHIIVDLKLNEKTELYEFESVMKEEEYEGKELKEFKMSLEYGKAIKESMEEAEDYIFKDILKSEIPSRADLNISKFWLH